MEFRLDSGQLELQQTMARFCTDRFPFETLPDRELAPVDRVLWAELAGLGVFGLLLPEDAGGSGMGLVDAALVFEQLGSHLVPGPVLWTLLAAPFVPGAATGAQVVAGVEAVAVVDATAVVEHAGDLDVLVVLHDDAVMLHEPGPRTEAAAEPLDPLDALTPVGRVTNLAGGTRVGGAEEAAELRLRGTVLTAALLAGVAHRALEVARTYALEREQFGAPIGSFQAIKHLLADMYLQAGLAQSAAYAAAAVAHDPGRDDPWRAARGAKLLASDAAITNASTAVQVLGGMGFTWEMLPNHLLKRAWVLEQAFGVADEHALHLGTELAAAR